MFGRTELVISAVAVLMAVFTAVLAVAFVVKDRQVASLKKENAVLKATLHVAQLRASELRAAAAAKALAEYTAMEKQKNDALKAAEHRAKELAASDARARAEHRRLRDDLARADSRISTAADEAVRHYAITANAVLGACQDEYREVAAKADGHASDVRTLSDAWPGGPD